jgi:DNA-binding winged helix-turn-helix (wHTH) protein/TolB-like protein/Flp pilus assembly protein TadD
MSSERKIYEFDGFRLDVDDKMLWRGKEKISLPLKAIEMLTLLIENRGRTVTKEEILETLWQDTFVDENNLAVTVSSLRKAFGESKNENRFIETVPRRGYRFVAEIKENKGSLILEKRTVTEITLEKDETPKLLTAKRKSYLPFLAILTILLIVGGIFWWRNYAKENTNISPPQTIAVLPFRHLAKDQEELSLTLTDALITKLAGLKGLTVRPTSSVLIFAENTPDSQIIKEKLKVENYLEGTIQKADNRLRISVQLVKTSDGSIIWAGSFNEAETDLLKLQDAISDQVVSALRFKISPQEQEILAKRETSNDEAFRLYLQGRFFWNKRNLESLKKSIGFYEQSLGKDAAYAMAYVGLADSYQLLGEYNGMPIKEAFEKARAAAQKAMELNPNLGEAHCSLAYTQAFYDWNWTEAEKSFKKAIELSPNYATAHQWYGEYLLAVGKTNDSLAELNKAQELDPLSLIIATDIAGYYYTTRQFDKAIEHSLKAIEADKNFLYAYIFLWVSQEQKGSIDEAAKSLFQNESLILPPTLVQQGQTAYRKDGWKGFWQLKYSQATEPPLNQYFSNFQRAVAALRIDNTEAVFEWLTKSYEAKERWFVNLKFDPQWDKVRNDARFNKLVRKANLIP